MYLVPECFLIVLLIEHDGPYTAPGCKTINEYLKSNLSYITHILLLKNIQEITNVLLLLCF